MFFCNYFVFTLYLFSTLYPTLHDRLYMRMEAIANLCHTQLLFHLIIRRKGASINYVGRRGGLAKCICYYISLCSELAYGGGIKNCQNLAHVVYGFPKGHFLTNQRGFFRSIWISQESLSK